MRDIISISLIVVVVVCWCFALHRNNWVYAQRVRLRDERWNEYRLFASYETMFKMFWVWDVEKFKYKKYGGKLDTPVKTK